MNGMQKAYALVIGCAEYRWVPALPPTVTNDARDLHAVLVDPDRCAYEQSHAGLLVDGEATTAAVRASLRDLAARADTDSTVLIFFSGHGARVADGAHLGEYLLLADTEVASPEALARTALSGEEFSEALRAIPARKVVVLFDCCHAGGIGQPKDAGAPLLRPGLSEAYYEALQSGRGRAIIASSRSTEQSWVHAGATNSLFTQHLLAGLGGGVASDDGLVRIFDLFEYLQPRVTADQPNQHPVFKAELEENFPVALYRAGERGAVPTDDDGFRYDAYLSYADVEPDAGWVWERLVPRLEAAGLRVAVSGDVEEPGVARVVGIERGIAQARRTVVVLSPAYLRDGYGDFENVLAQTMGVEGGTYRLLPVTIEPVEEVPQRLRMLTTLDLAHPHRGERNLDRLVGAVAGPLPRR